MDSELMCVSFRFVIWAVVKGKILSPYIGRVVIHEPDEVVAAATATSTIGISPPGMKQYKTYTEESLRQAITAVLYGTMKAADASHRYGIPLTTLTRKIRSSREVHTSSSTCNRPAR